MLKGNGARKDLSLKVESGTRHDLNFPLFLPLFFLFMFFFLLSFLFGVRGHFTCIKTVSVRAQSHT